MKTLKFWALETLLVGGLGVALNHHQPAWLDAFIPQALEESPNAGPARMFAAVLVALILVGWCTMMWTTARAPVEQRDDLRHLLRTGGAAAADRVISSVYSLRRGTVGTTNAATVLLAVGDALVNGSATMHLGEEFAKHGITGHEEVSRFWTLLRSEDMVESYDVPLGTRIALDAHVLNGHGLDVLRVLRVAQELGGELPAATPGGSL